MEESPPRGFMAGASVAWRGFTAVLAAPEVKRTYVQLAAAMFAVAIVLDAAGIWTVLHFTAIDGTETWYWIVALWLLRLAGIGIVLLAAPVLSMFLVTSLAPLLAERVFFAGMATVAPERAAELAAKEGIPLVKAVAQNMIRLLMFLGISILIFALSFVPVLGSVGGPVLQGYFTARAISWELLDPYFEKLELDFDAQRAFVREHRAPMLGFGLPFSVVLAIPFVGPLIFGIAQAAAGVFVAEVIEARSPRPDRRVNGL